MFKWCLSPMHVPFKGPISRMIYHIVRAFAQEQWEGRMRGTRLG